MTLFSNLLESFFRAIGYRLLNIITPIIVYFVLMIGLCLIFTQLLSLNILGLWLAFCISEATCITVFTIAYFISDTEAAITEMIKANETLEMEEKEKVLKEE